MKPKGPQPRSQVALSPTTVGTRGQGPEGPSGAAASSSRALLKGQLSPWAALAGGGKTLSCPTPILHRICLC